MLHRHEGEGWGNCAHISGAERKRGSLRRVSGFDAHDRRAFAEAFRERVRGRRTPPTQVRVLVDTNVLIALVDRSDKLHTKPSSDLQKLAKSELLTTDAVLFESVFALARADQRGRVSLLLERLPIAPPVVDHPSA